MNGVMRYFTKELWLGYNDQGPLDFKTASEQGERNLREYAEQLEQLRPRLSRQAYRFFKNENLHDGRLLAFMAGDALEHDVHGAKRFNINAHNPSVVMKVLGQDLDVLYSLKYTKVRKVGFEFPSAQPLFHKEGNHIGDWGYDELTAADDLYLRHEVLFASGAIILVEFKYFTYKKEACEGARYGDASNKTLQPPSRAQRKSKSQTNSRSARG
jgi:hypothetical protein